jgi:hypothetical protein
MPIVFGAVVFCTTSSFRSSITLSAGTSRTKGVVDARISAVLTPAAARTAVTAGSHTSIAGPPAGAPPRRRLVRYGWVIMAAT